MDDKVQDLGAYRHARGLCYTYGEKWSRDHTCGPTAQLHVVEELLDLLSLEPHAECSTQVQEAEACVISQAALQGNEPPPTTHLKGIIRQ